MASLGRVVVGWRPGDRAMQRAIDQGETIHETTRCAAGCGYPVFYAYSGFTAARDRDAEVICDDCYKLYKDEIQEAL